MSHLILCGCWSLNSVCEKRKWFHYLISDGTWTETVAGRQGCYFCSSESIEMYIIYCCVKNWSKEKSVLLSIKNDIQHQWDPLQKSAVTLSPIIHKTLLLWSAATCFFSSPGALPSHHTHPPPSSEDCSFNVLSHLSGFGCVFTFGIHRENDRPRVPTLQRPVLHGKTVRPRLECQTLRATYDPGRCRFGEKEKYDLLFSYCFCVCVPKVPPPLNSAPRFIILAWLKYRIAPGFRSTYLHHSHSR